MSTPSYEMLIGACAAHGLDRNGTEEELKRRLGDYLVAQLFAAPQKPKSKRASSTSTPAPKRPATAWHKFLREEKERVKESGFHGRVAILKECARRWALAKRVNTSEAPLMLTSAAGESTSQASSSSSDAASDAESVPDGLIEAINDLPTQEIHASLAAHGFPVDSDRETNVATLARAMMA